MIIEKIDKDLYFAKIGNYTTSGNTKIELLKNIIACVKLNIELKRKRYWNERKKVYSKCRIKWQGY